jgi:hypothetical protein
MIGWEIIICSIGSLRQQAVKLQFELILQLSVEIISRKKKRSETTRSKLPGNAAGTNTPMSTSGEKETGITWVDLIKYFCVKTISLG